MKRNITNLKYGWKFLRGAVSDGKEPSLDTSNWETVRVPHDWAIEGPFDCENDIHSVNNMQADVEDGVPKITGRTGGLPHVGEAWYRKDIELPDTAEGTRFRIEFDGVMSNSSVYCNGAPAGSWPYGYSSFAFDITDLVKPGEKNVIAVYVNNLAESSRWYPGAGIYRNVRLVELSPIHVAHWGTVITTPEIGNTCGQVRVRTTVENHRTAVNLKLRTTIKDTNNHCVACQESHADVGAIKTFDQTLNVDAPLLWSPDSPMLYTAVTEIVVGDEVVDVYETNFGFRSLSFDPAKGFSINGKQMRMNGVCMHHDLGPLGAAVNTAALERQMKIMQDMGCNAIRTSHNPPTPELLDICDRMGLLVICEAFDEWKYPKLKNGYHRLFEAWAERDLRAMIRRDRNHPCVIMWSTGNEINEQDREDGAAICQYLSDICHDEDPTRPTTAGFNHVDGAIKNGLVEMVDIPGWNYKPDRYVEFRQKFPDKPMYASETESTVSSRGEYYVPVFDEIAFKRESLQINSYDMSYPSWAYSPDIEFRAQDECGFMMGEFVWTGFDYLGEPTPYVEEWPSRSSYFGIVDLGGIPKDRYYLYQSKWTDKEVLHLLPHWNWEGMEGETVPVHCYTSYHSAELFVNGKSMGVRTKRAKSLEMSAYRLVWNNVKYEPGELRIVGFDLTGKNVSERIVRTAGAPKTIHLIKDRESVVNDGEDMAFVTVKIVDKDGNVCPKANHRIQFSVEGPAEILAVCNGDPTSLEVFNKPDIKVFNGQCIVYLRSIQGESGTVTLNAESDGLECSTENIEVRGG